MREFDWLCVMCTYNTYLCLKMWVKSKWRIWRIRIIRYICNICTCTKIICSFRRMNKNFGKRTEYVYFFKFCCGDRHNITNSYSQRFTGGNSKISDWVDGFYHEPKSKFGFLNNHIRIYFQLYFPYILRLSWWSI